MRKHDDRVIKCGRCGNWIAISAWKCAPPWVIHDNCPALSAKVQENPRTTVLRRRGGVLREIR
jgi:hypothetical protein